MNWEALGAIGEIAGAAGVIITLLYLWLNVFMRRESVAYYLHKEGTMPDKDSGCLTIGG